jgi:hypothetical protein
MYSYGLLEPGCYYLIQEKPDLPISLIKVTTETDQCMYIFTYDDQLITGWRRKTDSVYDIIECLTDHAVQEWEKQYNSNEGAFQEEEDDD